MSYEEKHNIASLVTLTIVSVPYLIFILNKFNAEAPSTEAELSFWASAILLLIPIRIVAEIIVHILFAIANAIVTGKDELDTTKDERDELISLKSTRNSYYMFCFVMLSAFIAAGVYQSITLLFLILFIGGTVSELMEISSKIYFYRKGA